MKNIVDGFLEMGENKFLHRDLKLANIFVNNGVAKIADFGFAKKSQYILYDIVLLLKNKSIMLAALSICHPRHLRRIFIRLKTTFGQLAS